MDPQPRQIELYETPAGRCPVAEYIEEVERKRRERAVIMRVLESIEATPRLPTTLFKKLKGHQNLWEIKIRRHRLIGFDDGDNVLVLVHAFQKSTQKTPLQDLAVAKARKEEYTHRKKPDR